MPPKKLVYKRVMLKLSGEALANAKGEGIDGEALLKMAEQILELTQKGIQVAVVIGGGNIWRYRDNKKLSIERVTSDYMGMLATVMNASALRSALHAKGASCVVMSALDIPPLAELYLRDYGLGILESGWVLICAGGTGNPYFTTDSAAALRAAELECDVILKATKVDGVYSADPKKDPKAKRYSKLSYDQAIRENLQVMDQAAFSICKENGLKITVFDMRQEGALLKAAMGEGIGTLIQ